MCDIITFLFNTCLLFGICAIGAVHEKSNDKLDRLCNKLDAINDSMKYMNTRIEEKKKQEDEKRKQEEAELQHNRSRFMAGIRVHTSSPDSDAQQTMQSI
jgi:hypothetical protein